MRLAVVGCGSAKRATPARARDLYVGQLFTLAKRYAMRSCDAWVILSAKHGVLDPDRVVAPYNQTLPQMPKADRTAWAKNVAAALAQLRPAEIVLLAGAPYGEFRQYLNVPVIDPMKGLTMGRRMGWLTSALKGRT